jgi:predicted nucleic acid-binding protein
VFKDADESKCEIVISALTIAEVLHLKGETRRFSKEMREKIRMFFRSPRFVVVDVDRFIAEHAQEIFWEHDIMPKDAIHVATALASNAHYLETFDGPLLRKSRHLGGDPQLVVQNPGADLVAADLKREAEKDLEFPGLSGPLSN